MDGLYEQLTLGRELLHETGSFIVQIGADNVHEVVLLMAEVFDRENHVATIPYPTNTNQSTRLLPEVGNWLIWFGKNKAATKYNQLYEPLTRQETIAHMSSYAMCELPDGTTRNPKPQERKTRDCFLSEAGYSRVWAFFPPTPALQEGQTRWSGKARSITVLQETSGE